MSTNPGYSISLQNYSADVYPIMERAMKRLYSDDLFLFWVHVVKDFPPYQLHNSFLHVKDRFVREVLFQSISLKMQIISCLQFGCRNLTLRLVCFSNRSKVPTRYFSHICTGSICNWNHRDFNMDSRCRCRLWLFSIFKSYIM